MEYDEAYPGNFLSSLNEMRKAEVMCDFIIKVDSNSFHVHSVVLAAASKYFTALFSSKMKEFEQASVDFKSLNTLGVKQCIQYMYTGGIKPAMESVQHTLEASTMIQLDGLTSICFKFLKNNLSVDTCLSTLNFSCLHGRDDISELAESYVLENFEAVSFTDMYPLISEHALLHYIKESEAKHDVAWNAVVRWFSVLREEYVLFDIMISMNWLKFPFEFLLETVLNDPMLNSNCKKLVTDILFENVDSVRTHLSTENFFTLQNLSRKCSEKGKKVIADFLAEHFEDLVKKDGFTHLEKDEIVSLFQSQNIECTSEETKWSAALRWIKYDQRRRKKVFANLFEGIKLELLSSDFIQHIVLKETLVKKSKDYKNIIVDILYARGGEETKMPCVACLDKSNGNIKSINLATNRWTNLSRVNLCGHCGAFSKQRQVINVCDEIFCLDFNGILKFDKKKMKWDLKQSCSKNPSSFVEVVVIQKLIYTVNRVAMACYNVDENSWRENLPGCGLDGYFCAASSDKFIYTMGGKREGEPIALAQRFDLVTESYSSIGEMRMARNGAASEVFQEKIFVVGGHNGREYLNSVEIYHILTETWTESIANTCIRRWLAFTCVADEKLYIVGGARDEIGMFLDPNSIEVFDDNANEWKIAIKYDWKVDLTPCCAVYQRCDKEEFSMLLMS